MDNKEQARVKVEAKCLRYAYTEMCMRIRHSFDRFEILNYDNEVVDTYKFVDLKDGDACAVHNGAESHEFAYYFNSRFWGSYREQDREFAIEYKDRTLIKKLNFNILEHLEGK